MALDRFAVRFTRFAVTGLSAALSACGGGGGGGATGVLSAGVTDLPAPGGEHVCIHFTGITLHHSDGDLVTIAYDPTDYVDSTGACIDNVPADASAPQDPSRNAVNLSSLQGELHENLMDRELVKAGRYNWIRLDVDESLSYVMTAGQQSTLRCPSCGSAQSGLKLNRVFSVPAAGETALMFDVDLGRALKLDVDGNYTLRPTLRLVNLDHAGTIRGAVDPSLLPGVVSDTDTGCKVYVYAGHGIVPDDYHNGEDNVLGSVKVLYDAGTASYEYVAAYLPLEESGNPTPYTVALTCDPDDPETDQNNDPGVASTDSNVFFSDAVSTGNGLETTLSLGEPESTVDFPPASAP
jgi:hypothetical protein